MPKIKINSHDNLLCPHCGDCYLHHDTLTIIERQESDLHSLRVDIKGVDTCWDDNEIREVTEVTTFITEWGTAFGRQCLFIRFWCEGCHNKSHLSIAQSNGHTIVDWIV